MITDYRKQTKCNEVPGWDPVRENEHQWENY